jgi:anti-sigma factor RsiW
MPMDHVYAEEQGLVESYLKDRLSESEREAFEAHYFACEACMEQLEAASDFREGMLQVAAEETVRAQVGLLAGLALLSRAHRLALAGLLLLLLALPLALLITNRGLERRLAAARITPAAAPGGEPRIASREQETAAGPQVNLPLFTLAAVRGGEEAGREPVNRVPLATTTPSAVFLLELAAVDYPSYRASLQDESGKETWQARDLRPDSRDSLVILLPSRMLPPGLYRLTIEGVRNDRKTFAVTTYPFRVVRP